MGNQPKIVTLVFPLNSKLELVLLGMKRSKDGDPSSGRWNGAGGKVEPGETVREAAVRELREEFGLVANPSDLRPAASIDFFFDKEHRFRCHAFLVECRHDIKSDRRDEEMERLLWFSQGHLPEEMWPSDHLWLPEVFRGKFIQATAVHSQDGSQLLDFRWECLKPEELISV